MEGKSLIIFDQDGTLADTAPGTLKCIREVARMLKKPVKPDEELMKALCGSFAENIKWIYDLKVEEFMPALLTYVAEYGREEGYFDIKEYPGLCDTIIELSGRYMLAVATMMFTEYSVNTLSSMDIDGCFLTIQGTTLKENRSKQDIINICLETAGCKPEEAVMVGDSMDDLNSARKAGIDFVGVTYGYGLTEEDCVREGVPFARKPSDLLDIL